MKMEMLNNCIIVFLSGFFCEGACVFWVDFSEKGEAGKTAVVAMFCAASYLVGIHISIDSLLLASVFVLGFGAGTFVAVKIKNKMLGKPA